MKHKARDRSREDGYTLLELLIVLVIIGLLVMVATPQVMRMFSGAKSKSAHLQINSITTALDYYQLDVGQYPTQEQGVQALWRRPDGVEYWNGPYVRKEGHLNDPWGRPFHYRTPGAEGGPFDLFTLGADNKEGGEGENTDIGNWD